MPSKLLSISSEAFLGFDEFQIHLLIERKGGKFGVLRGFLDAIGDGPVERVDTTSSQGPDPDKPGKWHKHAKHHSASYKTITMSPALILNNSAVDIIDIRVKDSGFSAVDAIQDGLDPPEGKARSFPTLLLYDAVGLRLFEEITYLDEYYLTNAEIQTLETHARTIAERLPENSQIVELGSGNLRKVEILLKQFENIQKRVDYWALDLSLEELKRTFAEVSPQSYQYVQLKGLHGTYDDAIEWLKDPENRKQPTCVISLGSSLGNFNRAAAAEFLNQYARLLGPADSLIIGLDSCKDRDRVYDAYNDSQGVTRRFYVNGLIHANEVLGHEAFKLDQWTIESSYNVADGCHRAFYVPTQDVSINGIRLHKGERVLFEEAYKYNALERDQLWRMAGLINVAALGNASDDYHLHMLSSANPSFATRPNIHLTRATRGKPTEPKNYPQIFERGVDPDVDNPEQCHTHSEIPDEWPHLGEILEYQESVRVRVQSLLKTENLSQNRVLSEAFWIGFEHEIMHIETFLYMLLQSDKTLPPTGIAKPDFEKMALNARWNEKPNQWFSIPQQTFTIGLADVDTNAVPERSFGWDNEKPQRSVTVSAFQAQGRAVTNLEYLQYMEESKNHRIPASWVIQAANSWNGTFNGLHTDRAASGHGNDMFNYAVRTVFGPVSFALAADWPVMASYDELSGYAKWMNCRLPTFEEARAIYRHAAALKKEQSNGVSNGSSNGHKKMHSHDSLFVDLSGANVGFKNWHPVPITPNGDKLAGQSELGGVWEWTSSPLTKHEGFEAMDIYPGYTSDFFDGKHHVVLGGSWATHPRIAGRKSFVNWYQHNYPYAWAGARLVRDLN
ncbi:Meiotically up-regulated gene 158 protein [Talaromyces islandicus]|uniref:Meiotically up-regulated gene 158 protein n=1 Tax=Talaromyces islandicus TaxID=28573 RepID=A0A0U1LLH7_TALIS|nr:Meiotically up-regulated gene 158 protein [Talaromyces islandicus]